MNQPNTTKLELMNEAELEIMLRAIESMHPTGFTSAMARETKIHNIKLELENRKVVTKE